MLDPWRGVQWRRNHPASTTCSAFHNPAQNRHAHRRIGRRKGLRLAHLLQRLRGVVNAHGVCAIRCLPQFKDQRAARRRVVAVSVHNPVQAEHSRDGDDIGIVAYKEKYAVAVGARRTGNSLACGVLLQCGKDVLPGMPLECESAYV